MVFRLKKLLFLIGVAGLLAIGVQDVYAAGEALFDDVGKDVKVTFKSVNPPNFGASDATSPGNMSWQNKWLAINVEFKPAKPTGQKSLRWSDDVKMNVEVLAKFKDEDGKDSWCLFTGTSEFWTIPRDGRKHVAAMFIPPQILDRHLLSHFETFVKVQFNGANPVYDKKDSKSTFMTFKNIENARNAKIALVRVPDAVLPRNLTPWAVVDVDKYDLLKPAGVAPDAEE